MWKRFHEMKDEEGFTLVELLVVIVILGILAGVVVFAVNGITDRGQDSACKTDRNTIAVAQEAHFASPEEDGGGQYVDEGGLVSSGFLAEASSLHDTAATGGGTNYSITPVGACAS